MKNFKRVLVAVVAVVAIAIPSQAQFRWGIKVGMDVNSAHFNSEWASTFDSKNRTGLTAGLITEFTVPIIGIGVDASLMYVHRVSEFAEADTNTPSNILKTDLSSDFLSVPINLKYKIGLPVVGNIITPYVFTGPSFAFRCSKAAVVNAYKQKAFDAQWNVGIGVQLVRHLQIGASYGWGMTKAFETLAGAEAVNLGRNNCWTITAAYLF